MTQVEAIEALEKGLKITHRYFSDDEFIYLKDGDICDEDDVPLESAGLDFWKLRQSPEWFVNWTIFEDAETRTEAQKA